MRHTPGYIQYSAMRHSTYGEFSRGGASDRTQLKYAGVDVILLLICDNYQDRYFTTLKVISRRIITMPALMLI